LVVRGIRHTEAFLQKVEPIIITKGEGKKSPEKKKEGSKSLRRKGGRLSHEKLTTPFRTSATLGRSGGGGGETAVGEEKD